MNQKNSIDLANKTHTLLHCTIELLTHCNWRCRHCYISDYQNTGLSKDEIFKIFNELRAMKTFELILTGGEMFLREDILDILSTARDLGFNLQLFSNLSVLSEKAIGFLSEVNIEKISCTIFSLSPQIHDGITQCRGSLEATLRNVLKLKARGVNVEIKNIIMRPNKDSYRALMAFCASHEIGYLGTTNVFPKHGDVAVDASLCIDDNDIGEILSVIDPSRAFEIPKSIKNDSYICNAIHHSLYIDSSGDVFPCNLMLIKLGSIFDSTIGDLWNHSKILRSLSELRWRDLEMCKQCHCRFYCYRCAGIALASSGSLCLPDPIECKIAHSRWKNYSTERH